jgi:hypothetical protein
MCYIPSTKRNLSLKEKVSSIPFVLMLLENYEHEAQSKLWGIINCNSPTWLRKWDIPLCFAQGIVRPANFSSLRFWNLGLTNSAIKFQYTLFLKLGSHYIKTKERYKNERYSFERVK